MGAGFGLDLKTTRHALSQMLHGGVKTYFQSDMSAEEVIDLIPVKPLEASENDVREAASRLHDKLTGR